MWRFAGWSRSLSTLVVLNTVLVSLAVGIGCAAGAADRHQISTAPTADTRSAPARTHWQHTSYILGGNLRVVAGMLAGICTLSGLTLFTLLWNAWALGRGLVVLVVTSPEALPLVLGYVVFEFSAFVLVASVAEHLTVGVLRCLAANEPLRLAADLLTLTAAVAVLGVAALVEADVAQLLRLQP